MRKAFQRVLGFFANVALRRSREEKKTIILKKPTSFLHISRIFHHSSVIIFSHQQHKNKQKLCFGFPRSPRAFFCSIRLRRRVGSRTNSRARVHRHYDSVFLSCLLTFILCLRTTIDSRRLSSCIVCCRYQRWRVRRKRSEEKIEEKKVYGKILIIFLRGRFLFLWREEEWEWGRRRRCCAIRPRTTDTHQKLTDWKGGEEKYYTKKRTQFFLNHSSRSCRWVRIV